MSWGDIDKRNPGSGIDLGRFLKFEDGKSVTVRVIDAEPHMSYVHKITQVVDGKEVFRSIPATENLDDDYISKNTNRWPAEPVFAMRVKAYLEGGPEIKVLQGGKQIFKQIKKLFEEYGDVNTYDLTISRTGEGKETEYFVSAAPRAKENDLDIEALRAEVAEDESLDWVNLYPTFTPEQQQKALTDAGFDVTYDPALKLMDSMDVDAAKKIVVPFGKYKDKTLGEIMVIDSGYLKFIAEKVTTNDTVAAAGRVLVNAGALQKGDKPKQIEAKSEPKKAAEPKKDDKRADLISKLNAAMADMDIGEVVESIKKHGNGKTKLKDLSVDQLGALYAEVKPA